MRVVGQDAAPVPPDACPRQTRSDVFSTQGSAQVDILLVLDTSAGQADILTVLPARLAPVLRKLMHPRDADTGAALPPPDFHLAVAPTNLNGELLPLDINPLLNREACIGTADLDTNPVMVNVTADGGVGPFRPVLGCPNCPRYLARSQCVCEGMGDTPVCANLFRAPPLLASPPLNPAGVDATTTPLDTLRLALGMFPACGANATPTDPPATNAGFYRPDAALVVVFVVGGDGPLGNANAQARAAFYRETVESLRRIKGTGKEGLVTAVTIGGICTGPMCAVGGRETLANLSPVPLDSPADYCRAARDAQATASATCGRTNLGSDSTPLATLGGCLAPQAGGGMLAVAPSPGLMTLACDLGGVIYNACSDDWASVITGSVAQLLGPGEMLLNLAQPSSTTTASSTCGDPTRLCVSVAPPGGASVDLPENLFDVLDPSTLFLRARLAAGARVVVTYPTQSPLCCSGSCPAGSSCNALGFCQAQTCSVQVGCAGDGEQCDVQRGRCLAPGGCSLDEHCPAGARCDCQAQRCVPREGGICSTAP